MVVVMMLVKEAETKKEREEDEEEEDPGGARFDAGTGREGGVIIIYAKGRPLPAGNSSKNHDNNHNSKKWRDGITKGGIL